MKKVAPLLAVIFVGALLASAYTLSRKRIDHQHSAYFSEDDGATFFEASLHGPPFVAPDGKPAVMAFVFSCDGGKNKFVGYLMRSVPGQPSAALAHDLSTPFGLGITEVKKPGPNHPWVRVPGPAMELESDSRSPEQLAYNEVVNVVSPTGAGTPRICKPGD